MCQRKQKGRSGRDSGIMARPYTETELCPTICSKHASIELEEGTFQLRTNQRKCNRLSKSITQDVTSSSPGQQPPGGSLLAPSSLFQCTLSHSLPVLESPSNTRDVDRPLCHSKFSTNSLCFFSFGWSSWIFNLGVVSLKHSENLLGVMEGGFCIAGMGLGRWDLELEGGTF